MAQSAGKIFERRLMQALKHDLPTAWVERNTDRMTGKGMGSVQSPPDLITVADEACLLIECKAVKGTSIPFDRLAPHQRDTLLRFNDARKDAYGIVAVLAYNGELGRKRRYDSWLIPIEEFESFERSLGRKSLPLSEGATGYLSEWHCPWRPGRGFEVKTAINNITGRVA